MLKLLFTFSCGVLLLAGCYEREHGAEGETVQDWSLKLEAPSEERVSEIGESIYEEFYGGRAILYARFGVWDRLYIHGYVPRSRHAIARFVERALGRKIKLEFGSESFPDAFASLASCTSKSCQVPDQCVRTFEGSGEKPSDVTGELIRKAIVRGYPIGGAFFEGTAKAYRIEVPFFADCDQADAMMARLRASLLAGAE